MEEMNAILEKVKKLWAKATDKAVTEEEAAVFTQKVHDLLARYNLDLSAIENREDEYVDEIGFDFGGGGYNWQYTLAGAVGNLCLCSSYLARYSAARGKRSTFAFFVGKKANIEMAKALLSYLYDAISRIRKEEAKRQGIKDGKWMASFSLGCASRLCARINQMIRDREAAKSSTLTASESTALAVVANQELTKAEEFMRAAYPRMSVRTSHSVQSSAAGYAAGYAAGDRIGLNSQIGHRA